MKEAELDRAKRALRAEIKERLAAVDSARRARCATSLAGQLVGLPGWVESSQLLSFVSLPSEIDTLPIHLEALAGGKLLGLPRISGKALVFHRVTDPSAIRRRNRLGVREPDSTLPLIDAGSGAGVLILVPGLAFDPEGRRLGRGGGFYDRFLISLPSALRVGVCFDFQLIERVPAGAADFPVDWIATDRRLHRTSASRPRR